MKYIKIATVLLGLFLLSSQFSLCQENNSEIKIETIQINDHIYEVTGIDNFDINVIASIGPDGILLVDAGTDNFGKLIPAELKKLSDADIKYLINTHFHNDHTGGNKYFKDKTTIIAHTNVVERMSGKFFALEPLPQEGLPDRTFHDTLTLHFNGEDIKMKHLPHGHTDSDILVYFTGSNILCVGDMVFPGNFPYVDNPRGGNVENYAKYIRYMIDSYPDDVRIIAGHRHNYTMAEMEDYHRMLTATIDIIKEQLDAGKTAWDMQKEELLKEWTGWDEWPLISANNWIFWVCQSLTAGDAPEIVSVAKPLTEVIMSGGVEEAVRKYHILKTENPDKYNFGVNELNMLGYQLMFRDMFDEAVEIFKLNIEVYPESGNAYDSMGEAYMNRGDKELAIKNYAKSLELDPENDNARQMLEKLRTE